MNPNESSIEIHARSLKMKAHCHSNQDSINAVIETMKHFLNKDQLQSCTKTTGFKFCTYLEILLHIMMGDTSPLNSQDLNGFYNLILIKLRKKV